MFKRKIIACLIALSLIAGMLGAPASANTLESSPQTATSLSDNLATATSDQGITIGLDDSFSEVVTDSQEYERSESEQPPGTHTDADTGVQTTPAGSEQEQCLESDEVGVICSAQPVGERVSIDEEPAGSNTGSSLYVPDMLIGMRPVPTEPCTKDGVILDISTQVDVVLENQASAKTGTGTAAGSEVDNAVSGTSKAVALNDAGQPVESSQTGALADNSVVKAIGNTGTATAATGLAGAQNTSEENTVTISSDTTVDVDVLGKIVDSNIVVKILYKFWAGITGLADATTGNSDASGLQATNSICSDDKAVAKGDAATVNGGGSYNGSALAVNESDNIIGNDGSALAVSGQANAGNIMLGNDILIAPVIDTLIQFCGDIIRSNVTIEIVYNFLAAISGQAVAKSGDTSATGADVTNKIDNFTSTKAVGDAPTVSGAGSYSDGSAMAINDTANTIGNSGEAASISGKADATNTMINNDIEIAPIVSTALSLLESIIDSNVLIRVTYNIWATVTGEATAETGNASASGVDADNSIGNISGATAFGDSAKLSSYGGGSGSADGEAIALNTTDNAIENNGVALSVSGDAKANNTMLDNIVNLSPIIDTVVMVVRPIISEGLVIIDIVYDIWATISGSANATSGDATSYGAFGVNTIDSSSEAYAVAKVTVSKPNGSAIALNSSDNNITNDGLGVANSGNAGAKSTITNAEIALTGYLEERCYIDGTFDKPINVILGASISERADANSGDAMAFGSKADSAIKSNAVSKDIFGSGGFSLNESDADILNVGKGFATTSDAVSISGRATPNNTQNKIIIGFGPQDRHPASSSQAHPSSTLGGAGSDGSVMILADAGAASGGGQVLASGENSTGGSGDDSDSQSAPSATPDSDGQVSATHEDDEGGILGSAEWAESIEPYVRVAKTYIDIALHGDTGLAASGVVKLPWWFWWLIVTGLLAGTIRLVFRAKPKTK